MVLPNFVAIDPVNVEIFNWKSENFDRLVALEDRSDHQSHWDESSGDNECL